MKHVKLDGEDERVKQFIRNLAIDSEGVELELEGRAICQVLPPLETAEKAAILERGRELVRRARQRNQGVPSRVLDREVRDTVKEVRRRKSQ